MAEDLRKTGKKVDLEQVDMDRMAEMVAENPGLIHFPHTVGGAMIKPEDKGKIKGRAVAAMHEQTEMQVQQIYEQMKLLADQANAIKKRVEVSERIYQAKMSFEPLIGKIYYLYEREDGTDLLSLIAPEEWGRSKAFSNFVAEVKLLADHTWEILRKG
ncbi:MAG: DUF2452 domain-containing protein [Roseivirga sp.]|nr:DUF2452 domain-containing protein [Roseivirga sp.]